MQVSKLLTTTVAAVAMAGALTMAYAQSTTPAEAPMAPATQSQGTSPATPDATTQTPSAASGSSSGTSSGSTPMASPSGSESTQYSGERPAQADRN